MISLPIFGKNVFTMLKYNQCNNYEKPTKKIGKIHNSNVNYFLTLCF